MVAGRAAGAAEAVVRSIVIARYVGIEGYAAYVVATNLPRPTHEILNANLAAPLIRFGGACLSSDNQQGFRACVWLAYAISTCCYLLYALVTVAIVVAVSGTSFLADELRVPAIVLVLAYGLTYFDIVAKAMLRLHDRFSSSCAIDTLSAVVSISSCWVLLQFYAPTPSVALAAASAMYVASSAATQAVVLVQLRRSLWGQGAARIHHIGVDWQTMTRFAVGNSLARTMEGCTRGLDVVVLQWLCGPPVVAAYDVARRLGRAVMMLREPLAAAALPQFVGLVLRREFSELRRLVWRVTLYLGAAGMVGLCGIALLAGPGLEMWGSEFAAEQAAVMLASSEAVLQLVTFWIGPVLLACGQVRSQLIGRTLGTVVTFLLFFVLAPPYSAAGSAAALLIGTVLAQAYMARTAMRLYRGGIGSHTGGARDE